MQNDLTNSTWKSCLFGLNIISSTHITKLWLGIKRLIRSNPSSSTQKTSRHFVSCHFYQRFWGQKKSSEPITCKHITEFIEHYLDHLEPPEVLIMDNARVHHVAPVKEKIVQLKRPVRYLPAYTPQLNEFYIPQNNIIISSNSSDLRGFLLKRL